MISKDRAVHVVKIGDVVTLGNIFECRICIECLCSGIDSYLFRLIAVEFETSPWDMQVAGTLASRVRVGKLTTALKPDLESVVEVLGQQSTLALDARNPASVWNGYVGVAGDIVIWADIKRQNFLRESFLEECAVNDCKL